MSLIVIHNICEVFFLPIIIIYRMRECFFYHLQQYDPYSTITRSRHGAISFFMYFDEITLGKCIIMFFSAITSLKDHLLLKWYTDSITTKRDHRNYIHTYSIFLRDSIIVLLTHFPQIAQNCSQHYLRHTKAQKYVSLFYSISCNHFLLPKHQYDVTIFTRFWRKLLRNYYIISFCGNSHNNKNLNLF